MYTVRKLADYSAATLDAAVRELLSAFEGEKQQISDERSAKQFRDRWFARKSGILTAMNELWLKAAPPQHKAEVGRRVNEVRAQLEPWKSVRFVSGTATSPTEAAATPGNVTITPEPVVARFSVPPPRVVISESPEEKRARLEAERVDVTLPGIRRPIGAEHPVVRTLHEMVNVFRRLGYSLAEGPEIETDFYNFEALNFPPEHPARDTQDTLFVAGQEGKPLRERLMLRTHTSPVQIRAMQKQPPPIRVIAAGKVHRRDTADATHSPLFHQLEVLAVDTGITFSDLKGTLDHAMKDLFGSSVRTRFSPSFFPFTEPSADVAISCIFCREKGCRICKYSGWIELLGSGMVHPNVFEFVKDNGYDPAKISGFAAGLGVDRVAILKYGVDDIQLFFQGDVRFLEQFA